jgi:hypothetical protein
MLYLVEMAQDRPMPAQGGGYADLKDRVCRTLERLAASPKVTGGVRTGGRALVFIIDAEGNQDLDRQLQDLPLWDAADRTEVTPLISFDSRLNYNTSK